MGRKGSNQTNSQTNSNVYKQAPRSKEQSHRDNFLVYPQDVFCLVEQLFTTAVATKTAYVGLRYVYSNIWLGTQENRLIETIYLYTFNMCIAW